MQTGDPLTGDSRYTSPQLFSSGRLFPGPERKKKVHTGSPEIAATLQNLAGTPVSVIKAVDGMRRTLKINLSKHTFPIIASYQPWL